MQEEEHPLLSISEFVLGQKVLAKHFKICHISYLYENSEKGGFFCSKKNTQHCIFVNYKKMALFEVFQWVILPSINLLRVHHQPFCLQKSNQTVPSRDLNTKCVFGHSSNLM